MCSSCNYCKHCSVFFNGDFFCILNQRYVVDNDSCDLFKDVNSDDDDYDFNSSDSDDINLF